MIKSNKKIIETAIKNCMFSNVSEKTLENAEQYYERILYLENHKNLYNKTEMVYEEDFVLSNPDQNHNTVNVNEMNLGRDCMIINAPKVKAGQIIVNNENI